MILLLRNSLDKNLGLKKGVLNRHSFQNISTTFNEKQKHPLKTHKSEMCDLCHICETEEGWTMVISLLQLIGLEERKRKKAYHQLYFILHFPLLIMLVFGKYSTLLFSEHGDCSELHPAGTRISTGFSKVSWSIFLMESLFFAAHRNQLDSPFYVSSIAAHEQ